mmetsp:Transcript_26490/g.74999  ORF Transcript_26490/g.74999 Transcript_26490/m.74999 type:complete len:234 (+) Transcript_26490:467-1168(+)
MTAPSRRCSGVIAPPQRSRPPQTSRLEPSFVTACSRWSRTGRSRTSPRTSTANSRETRPTSSSATPSSSSPGWASTTCASPRSRRLACTLASPPTTARSATTLSLPRISVSTRTTWLATSPRSSTSCTPRSGRAPTLAFQCSSRRPRRRLQPRRRASRQRTSRPRSRRPLQTASCPRSSLPQPTSRMCWLKPDWLASSSRQHAIHRPWASTRQAIESYAHVSMWIGIRTYVRT